MKKNNDYYKQVEQEIKQGKYQEGLRTRAIAEADGDESKARALYIKFRIESFKVEEAEAVREAKEKKERERLAELNIQLENLSPVVRRRKMIRIVGIIGGFAIGIVVGIIVIFSFQIPIGIYRIEELLLSVFFFGGLGACFGYVLADIIRDFIPSQCHLDEIEKERKYLTRRVQSACLSTMSSTRRFIDRACIRLGFEIGTFLRRLLSFLFRN